MQEFLYLHKFLKRGAERAQNELGKRYTAAITKSLDLVDIPKTKDVTGVIRRGLSGKKVKAGDLDPGDASLVFLMLMDL